MTSVVTVASSVSVVDVTETSATIRVANDLPPQAGNAGRYLKTNGTATTWSTVDALPAQAGHVDEYLKTDGTTASWAPAAAGVTYPTVTDWMRSLGDNSTEFYWERGRALAPDGTLYVVGNYATGGIDKGYLLALDGDGAIKWWRLFDDGTVYVRIYSVAVDADGFIWVTGRRNTSPRQAIVMRLRSDGTVVSAVTIAETAATYAITTLYGIGAGTAGRAHVAATYSASPYNRALIALVSPTGGTTSLIEVSDAATNVENIGEYPIGDDQTTLCVVDVGTAGNAVVLVDHAAVAARTVAAFPTNGTARLLPDRSFLFVDFTPSPDVILTYYDPTGVVRWSKQIAGSNGIGDACLATDGDLIVTFYMGATSTHSTIAKFDATGTIVSETSIDPGTGLSTPDLSPTYVAQDTPGTITLLGGIDSSRQYAARVRIDGGTYTTTILGTTVTVAPSTDLTASAGTPPTLVSWTPTVATSTAMTVAAWSHTDTDASGYITDFGALA